MERDASNVGEACCVGHKVLQIRNASKAAEWGSYGHRTDQSCLFKAVLGSQTKAKWSVLKPKARTP